MHVSKFLSLVLRHQPEEIGITLDSAGWVEIEQLLSGAQRRGIQIDRQSLEEVVANNDKQRFSISSDGLWIRANQGHSVPVELGYEPSVPPDILYHGTPDRFVASILEQGLQRRQRHHVHLHTDRSVALQVGQRRGKPVLLIIDAAAMHLEGITFFVTPNKVWLTDGVLPRFIRREMDAGK